MMDVSVIIPAYNRADTIGTTLWSLINQGRDPDSYEIIVVDNNSSDTTADVVREVQSRSPVCVRYYLEARPGVHYARNWGAVNAQGGILYYTDDDMCAEPQMLSELLKLFELDEDIATASGKVLPKWECPPPAWIRKFCENGLLSLQLRPEDLIVSPEDIGVYSCHQAIRRKALIECGGFNPENTGGQWVGDGETGLNIKIRARGWKFAYTGKSITYHMIPAARMTQRYLNRRLENQGNSDAFTAFRETRPDRTTLIRKERRCLLRCGYEGARTAIRWLRGMDGWRLSRAHISYSCAKWKYYRRLRRDAAWREFVLKDDWMQDELDRRSTENAFAGHEISR